MKIALATDGAEIAWESLGAGPALLLIAGQASSLRGWDSLVPAFAANHTVVRFDHRGVGQSEPGNSAKFSTRQFALDALSVLDAAGFDSVTVIGHSMGGRVAQWVAIDAAERVEQLVLIATTGGDHGGDQRSAQVSATLASGNRAAMTPLFFSQNFADAQPAVVEKFFDAELSRTSKRLHYRASVDHDAWAALSSISADTLIIHGDADTVTLADHARRLADAIPQSALHIEDGGLHALHLELPQIQNAIQQFIG